MAQRARRVFVLALSQFLARLLGRSRSPRGADEGVTAPSEASSSAQGPQTEGAVLAERTCAPDSVEAAFAVLLQREPDDGEVREARAARDGGEPIEGLARRLISSPEFRLLYADASTDGSGERDPGALERVLRRLGPFEAFVEACYRIVLGRPPDAEGGRYYAQRLQQGARRHRVLRGLLESEEFAKRFREISPQAGALPRDVQLCELANPAKWDNAEWRAVLRALGEPPDRLSMHRKAYEFAQTIFGLRRLGRLTPEARVISVGAGHEKILYWLANHVARVVATDTYEEHWQGSRAREGDAAVLKRPTDYAPFAYAEERLIFLRMDGRRLAFQDGAFDIAYSLSSIEHFGGVPGARAAVEEMARVLRPGGVLVLATEYQLGGPPADEVFTPEQIHALLEHPSLRLVEPIDEAVWRRYEVEPVDLRVNPYQTPHLVVSDRGTIYTSVMIFLEKT